MKYSSGHSGGRRRQGVHEIPADEADGFGGAWCLVLFVLLVMAAWFGAAGRSGLVHGFLFLVAGLAMVVRVPMRRPVHWLVLALGFLTGALVSFSGWFAGMRPAWWEAFEKAGLVAAWPALAQPGESAVVLVGMVAIGATAMWMTGFGIGMRERLVACHAMLAAVVAYTVADVVFRSWGFAHRSLPDFGFFPNRNHSAALLVMGAMVGLGVLVQAVRDRRPLSGAFGLVSMLWLVGFLLARSASRAGVLLLAVGFVVWVALVGKRYLRGHLAWVAVLSLLAGAVAFFGAKSESRERIAETMDRMVGSAEPGDGPGNAGGVDGRIGIARDTIAMISDKPWGGWGAGQFRFIFPQYRSASIDTDHSTAYHPESSWLWVAAESGVPAACCLFALAAVVVGAAVRGIRKPGERQRALRAACIAAALVPLIHGFLDVSPHRVGISWAGALLLALALPAPAGRCGVASRTGWRLAGLMVAAWGAVLLHGHFRGRPVQPSEHAHLLGDRAHAAYLADQQLVAESGSAPQYPAGRDPLENALSALDHAVSLLPLEPRFHGLQGMIALHFDDKDEMARSAFARQRLLDPAWMRLPLLQARAWAPIDPEETARLWGEALERAGRMDRLFPGKERKSAVEREIRQQASGFPALKERSEQVIGSADQSALPSGSQGE